MFLVLHQVEEQRVLVEMEVRVGPVVVVGVEIIHQQLLVALWVLMGVLVEQEEFVLVQQKLGLVDKVDVEETVELVVAVLQVEMVELTITGHKIMELPVQLAQEEMVVVAVEPELVVMNVLTIMLVLPAQVAPQLVLLVELQETEEMRAIQVQMALMVLMELMVHLVLLVQMDLRDLI